MMKKPQPKDYVMAIAPYVPGKSSAPDGVTAIKLSANENPLGTSEHAQAAFAQAQQSLGRYPDPTATALRSAIAAHYAIEADRIIYGLGSDEVLHLACGTYAGVGDEVIYVKYGFSVYDIAARRVGAVPVVAPDMDYGTDVDAILAALTPRTRVVFVANPNNPTGTYTARDELARLHKNLPSDVLLVVDQAYADYLLPEDDDGALELARSTANVLITRTFSKIFGLAAERIGWGYGALEIIDALHRIRAPFCLTSAGQAAAIAALEDQAFITHSRDHNITWRAWLTDQLEKYGNQGVRVIPSKGNFILVLFEGTLTAEYAYQHLLSQGYITRWLPGQGLPHGLRITIGTESDMCGLAEAISGMFQGFSG